MKKGLSQGQLSELIGVTKSMISAYECDLRKPSYETLIRLAKIYNVSTDYLLGIEKKNHLDTDGLSEEEVQAIQKIIDIIRNTKGIH